MSALDLMSSIAEGYGPPIIDIATRTDVMSLVQIAVLVS